MVTNLAAAASNRIRRLGRSNDQSFLPLPLSVSDHALDPTSREYTRRVCCRMPGKRLASNYLAGALCGTIELRADRPLTSELSFDKVSLLSRQANIA